MSLGIFDTTTAADHELPVLSDEALDVEMKELELDARRLAARRARLVAEKGRRGSFRDDGHATLAAWLRATGNWAPRRATGVNRLARLCCSMPSVGAALWSGRIGEDQADELARVFANPRCGHLLEQSIELLIDQAHRLSFHEFRICVRRWETLADAAGAHRDRGDAHESRSASVVPGDDLGVVVSASGGSALIADELAAIFEWFCEREFLADHDLAENDVAAPGGDLPRTDAQRRFDALVEIFRRARGNPDDGIPTPIVTNVHVDQHTFESALADHGLCEPPTDLSPPDPTRERCDTGRGAILSTDEVVHAALVGHVRRMVLDASGTVTNVGHRGRLFTGALRDAALAGSHRCEFPGCSVPASCCQIDHMAEVARENGRTNTANAAVLCSKHNRFKHHHFRLRRDRYGRPHFQHLRTGRWIEPAGRPPPDERDLLPLHPT